MVDLSSHRKKDRKVRLACFLLGLCLCVLAGVFAPKTEASGLNTATLTGALIFVYILLSRRWMIARDIRVPVLVYHSISPDPAWIGNTRLSLPPESFERQLAYLTRRGYRTVSLKEVLDHNTGHAPLEAGTIALTFDDGFLDNWIAAYPLLKKYDFQGTIFVSIDFIGTGTRRPNFEDLWSGKVPSENLSWRGYINWDELEAMEGDGVLAVESHTRTHTWLPRDSKVIDFYRPRDARDWVCWNEKPENKTQWFENRDEDRRHLLGHMIFDADRAHCVRRAFLPDPEVNRALNEHVTQNGGTAFFDQPSWRDELHTCLTGMSRNPGRFETETEASERIEDELAGARIEISDKLQKEVTVLCWPGDRYDTELEAAAGQAGYQTTTCLDGYNRPGIPPHHVGEASRKSNGKPDHIGETNHRSAVAPNRVARLYPPHCRPELRKQDLNFRAFVYSLKLYEGNYYYYIPFLFVNLAIKLFNRFGGTR